MTKATASLSLIGMWGGVASVHPEGREDEAWRMTRLSVDYDFLETLEIELVEGRGFSEDFPGDITGSVIVNEAMVRIVGWDSPIGEKHSSFSNRTIIRDSQTGKTYVRQNPRVIGVVKDFHIAPLYHEIEPVILCLNPFSSNSNVLVRIRPDNIPTTLQLLKETWQEVAPNPAI